MARCLTSYCQLNDQSVWREVPLNFCCGSKADVTLSNFDVRFTPKSGHSPTPSGCPLWANNGHQFGLEAEDASTL